MKTKQTVLAAIGFAAMAVPQAAFAQLDELVVTAERREAGLQTVPVAVSAFNASQIQDLQIDATVDIGANVPNLQTYIVTANAAAFQVHMRGSSIQNPGLNTSESPVGLYVDDIYRGRMATANLDLTDIERIEVLRGPQGTLYGRNTIAGAIKFVTRKPGDDFWANASVGYGSWDTYKVTASVGGPVADGFAASAAVLYHDREDGFLNNPTLGTEPGGFENFAGRLQGRWYGHDRIDATVRAWYVDAENDGYNAIPYGPNQAPPSVPGSPLGGFYDTFSSSPSFGATEQYGFDADITLDLTDNVQLRSITGWFDGDDRFSFDLTGGAFEVAPGFQVTGVAGLVINSDADYEQFSQELQWLGTAMDGRLEWLVGLYYLREIGDQSFATAIAGSPFFNEVTASSTRTLAAFGQGTYGLTDRLSITLGVRWTEDDKEFSITCFGIIGVSCTQPISDSIVFGLPFGSGAIVNPRLDRSFVNITPKASIDYQATDDILLYVSAGSGFQAGGFQTLCFGNMNCAAFSYEPQDVWSYEAGIKADVLGDRLRINALGFYAQYDDIQQTVITANAFPLGNVGEVDVWGAELELYASPVEGLNLFGIFGYMENDYGDVDPFSPVALAGADELPSLPKFTMKLGFTYETPLPISNTDPKLRFGLDWYYSDEYFTEATNALPIPSYDRLNGFIAVATGDDRWELGLTGKNLTNEDDIVSGIAGAGTNIRHALPKREWMVTLRANF